MHVPYRSGNAAIIDLLAGRVKVGSLNWSTARVHVAAGNLVPLAVSSAKRLAELPDLPTLDELGYPDMVTTTWHMLAGPGGPAAGDRRRAQSRGDQDRGAARHAQALRGRRDRDQGDDAGRADAVRAQRGRK